MKQLIATLIILGLVLGGGVALLRHYQETTTARAYDEALGELRRQFTERLGPARAIEDRGHYEREIEALLRWYFGEIQSLRNRFPGRGDPQSVVAELEARREAGQMTAEEFEEYMLHISYVRRIFERLESGDYAPLLTGYSGNLRLDVHEIERDVFDEREQLRADFVLWGAPRNLEERRDRTGVTIRRIIVPVRFQRILFRFLNARGHVQQEMTAPNGEPYMKVVHPERWVPEFPPLALIGRYWIELFPDNAAEFIWDLRLQTDTTGGSRVDSSYRWRMKVPDEWRLGGEWEGRETVRSRRYIEQSAER